MSVVIISPQADEDLFLIWYHIARDNKVAAEKTTKRFHYLFSLIAERPAMGARRDKISLGLRCHPADNYLIFYRPLAERIEIIRILHSARDIYKVMDNESHT